jgi:hypothetical protein
VEERETEKALDPKVDQEMTDVQGPFHEQSERGAEQLKERQEDGGKERTPKTESSKGETEAQRFKRDQTEQEGRKMVQESVKKGLKRTALERAKSHTLNEQEGQEQEKEPESQELTDLLKAGVRAQCTEVRSRLEWWWKCEKKPQRNECQRQKNLGYHQSLKQQGDQQAAA